MRIAKRVQNLPPYLFAELDRKIAAKRAAGADVISLGVGDPDLPTPRHVVEALQEAAEDPTTHQYPSYYGLPALRLAIAEWYGQRFDVQLDPENEVLPLIGLKEGLAHMAWTLIDPGDRALVPDPGYPVYAISTQLAGGEAVPLRLTADNRFVPALDRIEPPTGTKVIWLNYPSNPRVRSPTRTSSIARSASPVATTSCCATTPPIPKSRSTDTRRRASSRPPARKTSPWSSAHFPRPTT